MTALVVNRKELPVRPRDRVVVEFGYPAEHARFFGDVSEVVHAYTAPHQEGAPTFFVSTVNRAGYSVVELAKDSTIVVGEHRFPVGVLASFTLGAPTEGEPPKDLSQQPPDLIELTETDTLTVTRHAQALSGVPEDPFETVIRGPACYQRK
jgi:hypothetical protein